MDLKRCQWDTPGSVPVEGSSKLLLPFLDLASWKRPKGKWTFLPWNSVCYESVGLFTQRVSGTFLDAVQQWRTDWRSGRGGWAQGKGRQVKGWKQALGSGRQALLSYFWSAATIYLYPCVVVMVKKEAGMCEAFCSLIYHKQAVCWNSSGGFNFNTLGTVVVVLRGCGKERMW